MPGVMTWSQIRHLPVTFLKTSQFSCIEYALLLCETEKTGMISLAFSPKLSQGLRCQSGADLFIMLLDVKIILL